MVFHWRLSDSKSLQISWTLLRILTVFNNAVVWMVSTRPPTSKSSSPFNYPLVTVPKALITIGIIVTFMFHSFFFNSVARSTYLSLFSHSFSLILGSRLLLLLLLLLFFFFAASKFLTLVLDDGLLLMSEWQQVSSGFQDSSNLNFLHNSQWINLLTQSWLAHPVGWLILLLC